MIQGWRRYLFAILVVGASLLGVAAAAKSDVPVRERWARIVDPNDELLGRWHETSFAEAGGQRRIIEQEMRFTVDGHPPSHWVTRTTQRFDAAGRVVSSHRETLAGADSGSIQSGSIDPLASMAPPAAGSPLRSSRVSEERVTVDATGDELWHGRRYARLIRKTYDGDDLRSIATMLVDDAGEVVRTTQPMLGTLLSIEPVAAPIDAAALSPHRTIPHQMIASPYRIPAPAKARHIRYRFAFRGGLHLDVPQSGQQRMTDDGAGIIVDVCADCGPGLSTDPAALARWRRPSPWLESDAGPLVVAARRAIRRARERETMAALARVARTRLRGLEFEGHRSALAAWRRRKGDCTEDAALLAALGRAAGIATRVANGLVYSREAYHGVANAFMPHSWTLAYVDGRWESFDISLDGFDATHIALTIGDGDPWSISAANQFATLLEWQGMAEVRSRPKP